MYAGLSQEKKEKDKASGRENSREEKILGKFPRKSQENPWENF